MVSLIREQELETVIKTGENELGVPARENGVVLERVPDRNPEKTWRDWKIVASFLPERDS